ncbi:uncharacterized protein LOC130430467 [Triplophysa dalaica]|uniref:uncharacterized protein LOC130430467 n=1 Tax=Triplophysa dalaica TaxID=1582913 RepID=UPI0024DFDC1C|nr:uncharacterized protein LOC130430467 [Triplophysa dalaica]
MNVSIVLFLSLVLHGVGLDTHEVKLVTEGESVSLYTNVTHIQTDDEIEWRFGENGPLIARIKRSVNINPTYEDNNETEIFRDRLKMNYQTGDLTITHITSNHSGLYTLKINRDNTVSYENLSVKVYARLPVPIISKHLSHCTSLFESFLPSVTKCSVMCSVLNVSDVNVSWYKGKSLSSSISVSDVKTTASLHLELEYHDNNTYSCVVNNSIANHTQHLHITQFCHPFANLHQLQCLAFIAIFGAICIIVTHFIHKKQAQKVYSTIPVVYKKCEESKINPSDTFEDEKAVMCLKGPQDTFTEETTG